MRVGDWPQVAVLGAGAVGCYFGGMLARSGIQVTLITRAEHSEAINRNGLRLQTLTFDERVKVRASTEIDSATGADLVLLTVKTLDTVSAARSLAPYLKPESIVMSLQNGVDNVERIRAASGIDAVAAAIYVAVAMSGAGEVHHSGRGDMLIGNLPGQYRDLDKIAGIFKTAGVPCIVSPNIEGELWRKLAVNCAYNAISALTRSRYGAIVGDPGTRQILIRAVEETARVARRAGIEIGSGNVVESCLALGEKTMPNAMSSTAQDLARGKETEIGSLNGYVARRGTELGIETPVNHTLCNLIELLEKSIADTAVD